MTFFSCASRSLRRALSAGVVLAASLAGCGMESDPAPPPALGAGRSFYGAIVHPLLQAERCTACHATGVAQAIIFLSEDASVSYGMIKAVPEVYQPPADSLLWQKGEHQGPALSAAGQETVKRWLEIEFPTGRRGARISGDRGVALSYRERMDELSRCMDRQEWEELGMGGWPDLYTRNNRSCKACHHGGNGGTWLSGDSDENFEMNRENPYRNRLVMPVYEDAQLVGLKENPRLITKGTLTCREGDFCHDDYLVPEALRRALVGFQALTLNKIDSEGRCTERSEGR
jgi:hypothetical protein